MKNPLMYKLSTQHFETYVNQKNNPPVDCPITVFRGTKDNFVTEEHVSGLIYMSIKGYSAVPGENTPS